MERRIHVAKGMMIGAALLLGMLCGCGHMAEIGRVIGVAEQGLAQLDVRLARSAAQYTEAAEAQAAECAGSDSPADFDECMGPFVNRKRVEALLGKLADGEQVTEELLDVARELAELFSAIGEVHAK
jgi:hypothetical protein